MTINTEYLFQLDLIKGSFQKKIEEQLKDREGSRKNVKDRWQVLKKAEIMSAEKNVGYQNKQLARKPWLTGAMISSARWRKVEN